MWSKTVGLCTKYYVCTIYNCHFIANRNLSKTTRRLSYFHNVGKEPLRYITVGDTILNSANTWPNRLAVKSIYDNKSISYSELLIQADALGFALRENGMVHGDRIGIWSHNCTEWIVTMAAAARVGIIPVAINPNYEKPELSYCFKKVDIKGIIVGEALKDRNYGQVIGELIPEVYTSDPGQINSMKFPELKVVITCGNDNLRGAYPFDAMIDNYKNSSKSLANKYNSKINPDDGCIIHFTSGTTGKPKAALDSHFGIVNNTYIIGKRNYLHEQHHKICVQVPIFHAFGTVITVFTALQYGCTLVLPSPNYNPRENAKAIQSERCTAVYGTPTMFVDLISEIKHQNIFPTDIQVVLTAGAPCGPQLFRDIKQFVKPHSIKSLFGMTETTAAIFQSLPNETMEQVTDTVGCVHDHVEVKIVDDNNNVVPFGASGELLVRGYNTMMCYWNDSDKTKETLDSYGWLRTGDKFILQEDGYGRVVGRLKDIIMRGGENIAPKEIEDVLDTHPNILESQVIGVPDDRLGEELCAVIRLQNVSNFTIQELAKHCSGKLAKFKIPRLMCVVQEYPKTASGKIQKYKLKEMIEVGKL